MYAWGKLPSHIETFLVQDTMRACLVWGFLTCAKGLWEPGGGWGEAWEGREGPGEGLIPGVCVSEGESQTKHHSQQQTLW